MKQIFRYDTLNVLKLMTIIFSLGAILFLVLISYQWSDLSSDLRTIFTVLLTAYFSLCIALFVLLVQHWSKEQMLLISLKTIIEYILKELPTERLLTTKERIKKHHDAKTEREKGKGLYSIVDSEKENEKTLLLHSGTITIFNRNEVSPFNPSVFNEIINSGYFNIVLKNLVNLQLSLENYKQSRDYVYYYALEDRKKHNLNIIFINRAIDLYLKEIAVIKKELNI